MCLACADVDNAIFPEHMQLDVCYLFGQPERRNYS